MRKELEDKLAHRWPSWFNLGGDPMSSATARGFECGGGGGFQLVWRLCAEMEPLVAEVDQRTGERFEVVRVKSKLGTLRVYVSRHSDAIDGLIAKAQGESSHICEVCRGPGRRHEARGWIQTLCEEHAAKGEGE